MEPDPSEDKIAYWQLSDHPEPVKLLQRITTSQRFGLLQQLDPYLRWDRENFTTIVRLMLANKEGSIYLENNTQKLSKVTQTAIMYRFVEFPLARTLIPSPSIQKCEKSPWDKEILAWNKPGTKSVCIYDFSHCVDTDSLILREMEKKGDELAQNDAENIGKTKDIKCAALHPNKMIIATGGKTGVHVFQKEKEQGYQKVALPSCEVTALAFAPTNELIAAGLRTSFCGGTEHRGTHVIMWYQENDKWQKLDILHPLPFKPNVEKVSSLSFSQDGLFLFIGYHSGKVFSWKKEKNNWKQYSKITKMNHEIRTLACSEDGSLLAVGDDNSIKLFRISPRKDRFLGQEREFFSVDHIVTIQLKDELRYSLALDNDLLIGRFDTFFSSIKIAKWDLQGLKKRAALKKDLKASLAYIRTNKDGHSIHLKDYKT